MDQLDIHVAVAVLGVDTLWGGDVMCPSGTGRFIADSWFSDEPPPTAYTHPAAGYLRQVGGVSGKDLDRHAVETYLRDVNLPQAISGIRTEAEQISGLRGSYLNGLAICLEAMWDLAMEVLEGRVLPGDTIRVDAAGGVMKFERVSSVPAAHEAAAASSTGGRKKG